MTNEELAIEIQNGNKAACAELWKQIEKFVKKSAFRYRNALQLSGREYLPDADDLLIAEGYMAMLEAVKYYSTAKSYQFNTYLGKTLQKAFADVAGLKTERTRKEPLNNCSSLNTPVGDEDGDMERVDMLADEEAHNDYLRVEVSDTQQIIETALADLKEDDRQLIKLRYMEECSYADIARVFGVTAPTVRIRENRILRELRLKDSLIDLYAAFKA